MKKRAEFIHEKQFQDAGKLSQVDPAIAKVMVESGDAKKDKVAVKSFTAPAAALKPSQTTMVLGKSLGMALFMLRTGKVGGDLGAIVSADNYIMDGHHRWSAAILAGGSSAKVSGYKAALPGKDLVRVLNILTKGVYKRPQGNPGKGNLSVYTPGNVRDMLMEFVEHGIGGEFPWSPEDVQKVLEASFGSVEEGVDVISSNAKMIPKKVPSWAPDRADMPVINPEEVPMAAKKLQKGEVDWHPPYRRASTSQSEALKALTLAFRGQLTVDDISSNIANYLVTLGLLRLNTDAYGYAPTKQGLEALKRGEIPSKPTNKTPNSFAELPLWDELVIQFRRKHPGFNPHAENILTELLGSLHFKIFNVLQAGTELKYAWTLSPKGLSMVDSLSWTPTDSNHPRILAAEKVLKSALKVATSESLPSVRDLDEFLRRSNTRKTLHEKVKLLRDPEFKYELEKKVTDFTQIAQKILKEAKRILQLSAKLRKPSRQASEGTTLRGRLVRLAYQRSELRKHLLPLIQGSRPRQATVKKTWMSVSNECLNLAETQEYKVKECLIRAATLASSLELQKKNTSTAWKVVEGSLQRGFQTDDPDDLRHAQKLFLAEQTKYLQKIEMFLTQYTKCYSLMKKEGIWGATTEVQAADLLYLAGLLRKEALREKEFRREELLSKR